MINRGDVVIVDFPFTDAATSKVRPAVIVQNDPSHFLIDPDGIIQSIGHLPDSLKLMLADRLKTALELK